MSTGTALVWLATTRRGSIFHHVTGTVRGIADLTRCRRSTRTGVVMTRVVADGYGHTPCALCWPDGAT